MATEDQRGSREVVERLAPGGVLVHAGVVLARKSSVSKLAVRLWDIC